MDGMDKTGLLAHLRNLNFDEAIVKAFEIVEREDFIPESLKDFAYEDTALPIEQDATISQPSTIAFMLSLLETKNKDKILEIGSGSGYVLALLRALDNEGELYGVEINERLVDKSTNRLKDTKTHIIKGDGKHGLPERAPFDKILISAESQTMPTEILEQLSDNGILVAPIKNSIVKMHKVGSNYSMQDYPGYVFVPLK